ncbi:preprotein translocase subunit SecY [Desulfohalobium retbaense]|uniref:Protein translocase subunit SecY n=1 Tax=Desulfohalobium retbaense (strain ATCC 49708 / DSM 5692 / JCM 16813 / HR100) TaxID=485915 RepID=C8X455_DESRD|nr:preprotein translocase subunit SecY [Desulfohalobium retbaense]ACV69329.1 preprotein translocase, SecY subunit [Desulfohalobium retbaense DSM 5692]
MLPKADNLPGSSELSKRIITTFLLLVVYRLGIHIPIPMVDGQALAEFFANAQNTLFGLFDMFSGGGLSKLSIFALGIMPYISASIIIQLLTVVSPKLEELKKEGASGQKKITEYTRYLTVLITLVQGFGISFGLERMTSPTGAPVIPDPGWMFRLTTVITLTTGTVFLMWLGEQITDRGIGNGISLIIFGGIVARLPGAAGNTFRLMSAGEMSLFLVLLLLTVMLGVLGFIVFMERGQRRLPIHYAKRQMGRKMYGGQTSHLPLRVNTAGVIPPIFASSILMFPATVANFSQVQWMQEFSNYFRPGSTIYTLVFVALILFFCYFYTAIIFDPKDIADNLRKQGGFIPGIRPGLKTKQYIDKVLSRITLWGALYVAAICVLPMLLISQFNVPFYFGGTALLIVVGVAMDTMGQIQSHVISNQYQGLMQKAGLRGRR